MAKRRVIRPHVADFLVKNVGRVVTLQQITSSMPTGISPEAVQTCIRNLVLDGDLEITVIARGQSWRLESVERPDRIAIPGEQKEPLSRPERQGTLTVVGEMSNGTIVVKDEYEKLYRLVDL